jgi:hypothetical protein
MAAARGRRTIEGRTAVFAVPIALQELLLGVWLIRRGFADGGQAIVGR